MRCDRTIDSDNTRDKLPFFLEGCELLSSDLLPCEPLSWNCIPYTWNCIPYTSLFDESYTAASLCDGSVLVGCPHDLSALE